MIYLHISSTLSALFVSSSLHVDLLYPACFPLCCRPKSRNLEHMPRLSGTLGSYQALLSFTYSVHGSQLLAMYCTHNSRIEEPRPDPASRTAHPQIERAEAQAPKTAGPVRGAHENFTKLFVLGLTKSLFQRPCQSRFDIASLSVLSADIMVLFISSIVQGRARLMTYFSIKCIEHRVCFVFILLPLSGSAESRPSASPPSHAMYVQPRYCIVRWWPNQKRQKGEMLTDEAVRIGRVASVSGGSTDSTKSHTNTQ